MKGLGQFPFVATPRTCSRCGREFGSTGREYVCPECKRPRVSPAPEPAAEEATVLPEQLTGRQRQIYDMIGRCFANKEIAWELKLSEGTIKEYVYRLQKATGLTRYQMIREQALDEGRRAAACSLPCPLTPANEPQF